MQPGSFRSHAASSRGGYEGFADTRDTLEGTRLGRLNHYVFDSTKENIDGTPRSWGDVDCKLLYLVEIG